MSLKLRSLYFDLEEEKDIESEIEVIDLETDNSTENTKEKEVFIVKNFIRSGDFKNIKRYFLTLSNFEKNLSEFHRLILYLTNNEDYFNIRAKFIRNFILSFLRKIRPKLLEKINFNEIKVYLECLDFIDSWKKSILEQNYAHTERMFFEGKVKTVLDKQTKMKKREKNRKSYDKLLKKRDQAKTTNYIIYKNGDDDSYDDDKVV